MRVLAIGAHFDDIELGCGGSLAKHRQAGDEVHMLVVTDSAYTDYRGNTMRTKEIALHEGKAAAAIIGARLICGDFPTQRVPYSVDLIELINAAIDELKIDLIYTHWANDVHQDHSAVARATLSAGRHVPRILMYRSNWYAATSAFRGNFYVDITSTIDTKVRAVKAHESEYEKLGETWIEFFVHQNRNSGLEIGTEYAEVFEVVKYLVDHARPDFLATTK